MDLQQAIRERHSVRKYTDRPVEPEKAAEIQKQIDECNAEGDMHIQLVQNEPLAFSTGIFKYGQFSGVKNYIALVVKKDSNHEEAVGYYGQKIVLLMQSLGLNSCWVGLTFKNIKSAYQMEPDEKLRMVIACGYGESNGAARKLKPISRFYKDARSGNAPLPEWFERGMEAALLAPTAMNRQKFFFTLLDGNKVAAKASFDLMGYAPLDLGIVKCNFEIAAGKENFEWA